MELLLFVSLFCVLTSANGPLKVTEDSDAVLPCSLSTKENIETKLFDWKKDGQEVFFYNGGGYYGHGISGQDKQFEGRVSHFNEELKNGNASIKITETKMADSGNYTCIFPRLKPRQQFTIELVVECILKDRTKEEPVACRKPSVQPLKSTSDQALLQCEVEGASPEPKVEWRDSSGNILEDDKRVTKNEDGSYDIILQTTVTKNDNYDCVVTQDDICHQIYKNLTVDFLGAEISSGQVKVKIGQDAVLPCSLSTKENIQTTVFDWKKDGLNVFFYNGGYYYGHGISGQDEQFEGRVSHFNQELKNGNASIKIRKTKMADSGVYTCIVPRLKPRQQFIIELVVAPPVGWIVAAVVIPLLLVAIFALLYKRGCIKLDCKKDTRQSPKHEADL